MKLLFHGLTGYRERQFLGPARWPHHDLLAVKEGEVLFQTSKGDLHLQGGDAVWIPPKLRFQGIIESKHGLIWVIHFRDQKANPRHFAGNSEAGLRVFRGGIHSDLAVDLMERLHEMHRGSHWPSLAPRYLSALLAELDHNFSSQNQDDGKWINKLEQWCLANFEKGVVLDDLAKHMGFSLSHFRKLFREQSGMSAGKFLHNLRLSEAKKKLQHSLFSLKEIAHSVGYADVAAFNRAFSKHFKIPPAACRKKQMRIV